MAKREAVAERDDDQGGTYRLEMISCGKDRCRKCAEGPGHGPYWYRYYRRGGRVVSKYVGKQLPAGIAAPAPAGAIAAAGPSPAERLAAAASRQDLLDLARELGLDCVTGQDNDVAIRVALDRAITRQAAGGSAEVPVAADASPEEIRAAVRAAYTILAEGPGDYVRLRELRELLPGAPRGWLDAELVGMYRDHAVNLVSQANQMALLEADREAAVHMGEFIGDKHRISIERDDDAAAEARPPEPAAPTPVSGQLSARALTPNRWGTFAGADYPVNFHADGRIGIAINRMGTEALLDVDGEPLAELLGRAATDAVVGRASSQEVLERITLLRDRLPQGGAARRELDEALDLLDAPASPVRPVPPATLAPLRQLMADLHAVPLVRRDPSQEEEPLARILDDFAAGKTAGSRLLMAVRGLRNVRHESVEGKFEIDRAVSRALDALEGMHRADRKSLYPPAV